MSFVSEFNRIPMGDLITRSISTTREEAARAVALARPTLADFPALISPAALEFLEVMSVRSQQLTRQRFGKTMRFFAPLYLSNECINNCKYCGFSRDNAILRVTLSMDEIEAEARELHSQGFRNILLVAGEHPKFISKDYLRDSVARIQSFVPGISLEIGPMEQEDYEPMVKAGAEGLVVYQETYDRTIYDMMHTAGPKKNFDWRLETPERAYDAGFRRIGIGALYGLSDWRLEAFSLAAHTQYLLRRCWKAQLTIALPRLRPNAGDFEPLTHLPDREMVQLICAMRLVFQDVGIVLSTREPARLRDGLIPLGITHLSAGSHTEPGGYTGAGRTNVHLTEKGRIVALDEGTSTEPSAGKATSATGQFDIADERSVGEVADLVSGLGYEPVFKDWDAALIA